MIAKGHSKDMKGQIGRRGSWRALWATLAVFAGLAAPWPLQAAQPGKDGDAVITSANTIVNAVSALSQSASAGDTFLRVTNLPALLPLSPGDLLLVYQAQGADINTSDSPSYGAITAIKGAGLYEFVTVVSTQSPNRVYIVTSCGGLRNSYVASAGSQVVKVPQYRNLTVQSGASITAPPWNGSEGGIVALSVRDTLELNGTIDVSAKGFRGGAIHNSSSNPNNNYLGYRTGNAAQGAAKGESIADPSTVSGNGQYGRGAPANGGGGGNSFNSGGGGGANGDNGGSWFVANNTRGGQGVMETDVASWLQAWQLDPAYTANGNQLTNCAGGGRGGYSFSANDQNALTVEPGNASWGGNLRREKGGWGGRPLPNNPATRVFFGGGGGAGDGNDSVAGRGGNGGGLVFIIAGHITGTGEILADGENGGWSGESATSDSAGGGGAGGSIVIMAGSASGSVALRARGGEGGWQPLRQLPTNQAYGPGGGGGGGYIAYNVTGFSTVAVDGGAGGRTTATAVSEFPPNGATAGSPGATLSSFSSIASCDAFVSGLVFNDLNNDGIRQGGEPGLSGVPVVLTLSDSSTTTVLTASDGSFFYMAPSGSTSVNVDESGFPFGWVLTTGNDPQALTLSAGVNSSAGLIGYYFPPLADLSIEKTDDPDPVYAGDLLTYTVVVTNNGPDPANNVLITDTLPSGVNFVSASVPCTPSGGGVSCSLGTIPAGASTTVTIVVQPMVAGTIVNTADVTSDEVDPNPNNNSSGDISTDVLPASDLVITKSADPAVVLNGQPVVYTIVVSNAGPSDASNVVVSDTLDPSFTITSVSSGCTPSGNTVTCSVATLAAGDSTTFTVTAVPSATGTYLNGASVVADEYDPDTGNNADSVSVTVDPAANLSLTKTASVDPVAVGTTFTYEIVVTNAGPDTCTSATVTDYLPAGVQFVSASSGCAESFGVVACDVGPLAGGESTTVTITVLAQTLGPIQNTAIVVGAEGDPNGGDNVVTLDGTIEPDCNANGVADSLDIANGTSEDCNANGIPDECDISSGASEDCNGNGIPDECETDCNGNGIPDDCDILNGTSEDCNGNGVPDECDMQRGSSEDCNTNGVPDECDLSLGTSQDCNSNNIPDECDIAQGTAQDCNSNGIPDDCDIESGASQDCNTNGIPDECDLQPQVGALVWSEDFESGLSNWSTSGLWRLEVGHECLSEDGSLTTVTRAAYNDPSLCTYNVGSTAGALELTTDVVVPATGGALRWYNWVQTENVAGQYDLWWVEVSTDGGASWQTVYNGAGVSQPYWQDLWADLSAYAGQAIRVRFVFDSIDGAVNAYLGWYIDDVRLFESVAPAFSSDCNSNGVPDECDLASGSSQDCNSNTVPDECDILSGASDDCDGNGVPDECEPDCNGNGQNDLCDVWFGFSVDCNGNQVPDECELDCNGNGVLDTCDILYGISGDCNINGVPDECDLNDGTSEDCNANGIPDECELYVPYGDSSPALEPWYAGSPQSYTFIGVPDAASTVAVVLASNSDLGDQTIEYAEVYLGGTFLGNVWFANGGNDCADAPGILYVGASQFNSLVALGGGDAAFDLIASPEVDPFCADPYIAISLDYLTTQPFNDCNSNGVLDECDITSGTSQDCNGNGIPDECDIVDGTSEDCNGNGVPDECDIQSGVSEDCNGNGIPDECDLANGSSEDCNLNNIPDECDLSSGTSQDCNANNIPDECDIADGTSEDCNGNGVPDECDIQSGVSEDCNGNGIPDECDLSVGTSQDCNSNNIPDECDVRPEVGSLVWSEDFESGLGNWSASGLWRLEVGHECLSEDGSLTTVTRAAYNDPSQCTYDVGETSGVLELTTDVVVPATGGALFWYNWVETEDLPPYDGWRLEVSSDGGSTWQEVFDGKGLSRPYWQELWADVSAYAGQSIRVRFVFDSLDDEFNDYLGWYVDDVRLYELAGAATSSDCNINGIPDECEVDCNGNGVPDDCDLVDGTSEDCNGNAVPDECDIQSGTSEDCNTNGIPDECDLSSGTSQDCNANGIPDECDLASGASEDCNGNGIPDECDIADGTSEDCNLNNVPDECDLSSGTSEDCNGNNIPDECDIADSTSEDCNSNGIPDDCDIQSGASDDCNVNSVPDECDIANGTSQDCNSNGVPDECDLSSGASQDCNANNIPDECDIASGTSQDCNSDGLPDECGLVSVAVAGSDECSSAPLVLPGLIYNGDTTTATQDGSESCTGYDSPDVWYRYIPAVSGTLTISLCGSSYDTALSVHTGCPGDTTNEIACNDDSCDLSSEVTLSVTAGEEYLIRIGGYDSDVGTYRMQLFGPPALGLVPDCNANGTPDECDITSGTSQDCNANGIPDECEPDCNGNGIADECDISSGSSEDCNENGVPDECDLQSGASEDCNANGIPDECDIADGVSDDCDENGVPDECEPDCNGNGQSDLCDIWMGFSEDCNWNAVPDECEPDCNGNGVADNCDILFATSADCNTNGVPDECDIQSGNSTDCNANGIPDECELYVAYGPSSPALAPWYYGSPQSYTFTSVPDALSSVTIVLVSNSDLGDAYYEYAGVYLGSTYLGDVRFANGGNDCVDAIGVLYLSAAQFNSLVAAGGGDAAFDLIATPDVEGFCPDPYIAISLNYLTTETLSDCNSNGVLDECETDCNGNGVPDDCDLSSGTSEDCNSNGVPDECDIQSGTSEDCNTNNIPDECDLANGTSQDCNLNSVPDECDIASGASGDLNGNGVPDECDPDCNSNGVPDDLDIGAPFEADSGLLAPWYAGSPQSYLIVSPPPAATAVQISLTALSDLGDIDFEYATVDVNGVPVGDAKFVSDGDCTTGTATLTMSAAAFNAAVAGGDALIGLTPSPDVGGFCDDSFISVHVMYVPVGVSLDCNQNGIPDECDIADGTSQDCNANGIPDECEADCNDNGVADDCDLTSGTSQDCNSNAIPDECDIASGFSEDCNSDDIPDECQLVDVVTQIAAAPNLGIVGQPLDLTVTFSNSFGTATQLSAIIVVPGILPVTNVTTTMGSVTDLGGGLYQLDVPSLPGMGAAVVTISTLPSATGAVQVLASASTCIFDFDPENNVDALFVRIGLDCNTNGIEDEDEVSPTEGAVLFHEDFESGLGLWDASGLWHVAPTLDCVTTTGSLTPATAAIYNTGSPDCNYDVGITQGALELTTDVVIPAPWGARLKWFNFVETENSYPYDNWLVQVSSDGGTNWQTVYDGRGASRPGWQELSADLTQFAGQAVRIRFVFDSLDAGFNAFFGWYVDDVRLIALDAPLSPDCNQNHIPDECDITGGTSTDCNANSIPDECELDQVVAFASGVLEPFDGTTSQSFVVSSVPPAIGMVTLHLTAYGDFGDPLLETVDFYLNGTWIATTPIYTGGQDCTYGTAVVHIPQATYNALTSGGFAQFDFVANPNVNACAGSFITAMFDYLVLDPAKDCNSNGILDECETDCNENGVPDDCDLSGGVSQDCNANNVPDECDISQGTSQDCNSNSVPDECDLQSGASQDCNDNNVPDECDIASGASEDCNANGVPDECDLSGGVSQDCNGNGVPDECDISDGTSEDCNSNNIPDECDLQSGASQDCNSNSVPDECDIASGTSEDCNGNGIPDECDVASGASEDCNENGIPDECETDCNSNGVPDDCDIAGGSSEDCNSNNIPDECDIQSGASEDCNGNGIPDECDLANGSSEDCNSNNIPDECDLSGGTSQDCNANNIPDECDIVDGTSEDCNGNGVPDECDIQSGVSEDCNGNGIPDECDLSLGTSQDCNSNNIPDECDVRPEVGALVWSEDFESGLGNWSTSGLWRLEVGHECLSEDGSLTTVTRAAYNDPSQCSYDVGETSGVLELQTDVSVPVGGGVLFWYNWVETEDLPPYDGWRLEVSSDGGSTWQEVFDGKGLSRPYWQELWADVSAYAGQSIRVRFVFDSLDDEFNDYLGWYVDDVRLYELAGAATSSDCNINGIPDECEVDCNGNGVPDDCDLLDGTSEDCNGNAVPDECDIQSGTSEDCNTNGIPDECDLSSGTSQDCNANGIPDECDIASGASEDCNGNNIPDECETDCNVNGVPDDCDIAEGTSEDCNANGVPDECDIQSGTSQDCNSNNVPDECDLSSGSSQDCNDNSVPDECDISSGTSEDCNSNNVPDECDIKSGTSEDCNVNNIPDECDIATGASEDCNANGTPDECETDCNENGVPDDCDIAEGTSGDCNANSIPDECDLANGTSEDCNSNGIPDECDISDGTSEDCNENGVPDECDLTSGLSQDCNENGIPDECETDCNENGVPDDCDIGEGNSRDDNFDGVPDECQSADLAITKLGEINPAQAGYQLVYTLVVHNLGPAAAPNVVVVDPLPAGVTFVSASSTKGTCSYVPHTVTCTVGLLAVDEVATVTITTIPMTPGTYDNTASVASSITDTVTANDSSFVSNDVCDPFTPIIIDTLDPLTGGDSGWRPFAFQIPDFADQIYDTTNTALVARITADPTRFRTAGHVTLQSMWLPYSAVGSEHYVRGKFYVFAKGITDWSTMTEGTDWTTTGAMPNVRLRLSHRFAQNSMLEVFNHRNIDPEASDAVGADIRPSTDPSNPSLYRVDFDPVDTPYLRDSGTTEGIWAAYEAYSVDPQDQGIVGLTEVQLGVYPASLLPDSVAPVKVYAPSSSDAGTLAVVSPTDLQLETRYPISGPGDVPDLDPSAPLPQHFEGPEGITLSTVGIPADRLAIAVREFDAGSDLTQRVRVEANKIYKVRFHVTSTKPTNVQPQFRGRTRTARFLWSQKMEVGGAWNAGPESNADAQQALPGVGCLNPDRAPGDTTGGWYTLLFHSPLNPDIRPEFAPGTPVETRMPGLAAQPGPGVNAASLRDLRVGFDVLDTLSGSALSGLEEGEFTLDRIEIRVYDEPGDSGWCPPIPLGSPSEE